MKFAARFTRADGDDNFRREILMVQRIVQRVKQGNPWIAPGVSAGIAFVAFSLHLMGHVAYQKHLASWGLDVGLFPPSLDELAALGWFALVSVSVTSLTSMGVPYLKWGLILIAGVGGLSLVLWLSRQGKVWCASQRASAKPAEKGFLATFFRLLLPALAGLLLLPMLILLVSVFLLLPVALGTAAGKEIYELERKVFAKGCQIDPNHLCVDIKRDGQLVSRGFVVASSSTHVAIFEPMTGALRVIERAGTELFVVPNQ